MRRWLLFHPFAALLVMGCAQPAAPVLRAGDVVRPEVSFAPKAPWRAGAKVAVGVLARIDRPGGETFYLNDEDVPLERTAMSARLTFLDGERAVGDPIEVPLVHDC